MLAKTLDEFFCCITLPIEDVIETKIGGIGIKGGANLGSVYDFLGVVGKYFKGHCMADMFADANKTSSAFA
jgi:hypothetical protein